ncbi:MAG: aminopeptidase P family protein [Pseudomonadota bacterium]
MPDPSKTTKPDYSGRLSQLRALLADQNLDGFVVPMSDANLSENIPDGARRIDWLSGFGGSAGIVVVLADRAAIFVDGRYTIQVRQQVDGDLFEYHHLIEEPHLDWVAEHLPKGGKLGYDPWLHTAPWVDKAKAALENAGCELAPVSENPIDQIWHDQPPPPLAPIVPHPEAYAGKTSQDKRRELGESLAKEGVDAAVLGAPDSIAWLLNVRGGDTPNTPLPLSYAILKSDGQVDWFVAPEKLTDALPAHLGNQVGTEAPSEFRAALDRLGEAGKRVSIDPASVNAWIAQRLNQAGAKIVRTDDPCSLPKARKNEVELEGARQAHLRDGATMAKFLTWLAMEGPTGNLSELDVSRHLHDLRAEGALYKDDSFEAISAWGPNAALAHYRVTEDTNATLQAGTVYLTDSGGQYLDGTTDITRTIALGEVSDEIKRAFTLVLKGHIAIATARFPKGTTGSQLDTLARQALWQQGMDFDHGTGHGVGSYLGVHEGPARISKAPSSVALEPGMILSNEPGYYKADGFGIRTENLVAVTECSDMPAADKPFLCFETLTFTPIDRSMILPDLLTEDELAWLNDYHAEVRAKIGPQLAGETKSWLEQATEPLG